MEHSHAYLAGIELFNAGKFWHAHEEWEGAWLHAHDPQSKLFYQAIIQTAAALVHWQKGNPKGLHLNWAKARAKFVQLPPEMLGLPLHEIMAFMDQFEAAEGAGMEPPQLRVV